jgi:cutinase
MRFTLFFAALVAFEEAYAIPQSKGKGGGGGDLIGGLLKGMGGSVPNGPAPKGCSKYEILVARGTGEPGPFGSVVGDQLVRTVTRQLPGSRGYAVQYPANMNMTVSLPTGVKDTTSRLSNQIKACPDQKFAIVGYSQGAGVMHAAAAKFDAAVISKVVAAVMFGDPGFRSAVGGNAFPAPIQARLKENCNPGDPVCDPKGGEFSGHLAYSKALYQKGSADFIVAAFKGQPLPKAITSAADPNWPGNAKGRPAAKGQSVERFSILKKR